MTQVLVTRPGALTAADKRALRKAGVVPIEAESPDDVRLLQTEGPTLSGDDMLFAAISAMAHPNGTYASDVRETFPVLLHKLLVARREGANS